MPMKKIDTSDRVTACSPSRQPYFLTKWLRTRDMTRIPAPWPLTTATSTSSRLFLKYWPSISMKLFCVIEKPTAIRMP